MNEYTEKPCDLIALSEGARRVEISIVRSRKNLPCDGITGFASSARWCSKSV